MKDRINAGLDMMVDTIYPISRDIALPGSIASFGLIQLIEGKYANSLTIGAIAVCTWALIRGLDFVVTKSHSIISERLHVDTDTRPLFATQAVAYTLMSSLMLFGSLLEISSHFSK